MYAADLHVHSRFAFNTSKSLDLAELSRWARLKGIDLLSTGDFTHPAWLTEISGELTPLGNGLYECGGVRFVLGTEVSLVCRLGGRSRRVHLLVFAPSLEAAARASAGLSAYGRMDADGRPTLRISPRDLCHRLYDIDPRCFVIAAHLWTPWFGAYGQRSGFDSLEECFGDATPLVPAVETGLSADPAMAWGVPSLDDVALVSFSDAHSAPNLGRELTVLLGELSYEGLLDSLRGRRIALTIEYHPAEGKYHHTGHRKCGYRTAYADDPGALCPVCGRKLTVGVLQRVEELTGRSVRTWTDESGLTHGDTGRPPFRHLVGLRGVVSEALGVGPNSARVLAQYLRLVEEFGGELAVLLDAALGEVAEVGNERIAEGVGRVRSGRKLAIEPGYDGVYGSVRVWPEQEV